MPTARKIWKHCKPAYSLIFVLLSGTLLLILVSSINADIWENLKKSQDWESSVDAKDAAYSSVQDGVLASKNYNAGYEVSAEKSYCFYADYTINTTGDGDCATWGDYTVYAKARELFNATGTGIWYTPMPGTGTAGDSDDCSILDEDASQEGDADHSCNWNKLLYGESVTIPLYSDDGSGGISIPDDLGLNGWTLRVRTPCDPDLSTDIYDPDCTRYVMDETDSTDTFDDGGDSVIFWQLVGEEDTDGDGEGDTAVSVVPVDEGIDKRGQYIRSTTTNTEIYEELINEANFPWDYEVMEVSNYSSAPFDDIYDVCMNTDLTTLSLQLTIVNILEKRGGGSIPYLEWQLVTDSNYPVGDNKSVIIGEGYHQGIKHIFYYPIVWTRSTTEESTSIYTLSN